MNLSNKIIILDNTLSEAECSKIINVFNVARNGNLASVYRDTLLFEVVENTSLYKMALTVQRSVSFLTNKIGIDWCHIVEWPAGSKQNFHIDDTSGDTVFTSITYLNDDYAGGETQFLNDISVVPKRGRTVYFDGNYYTHGVNEITSGTRYTLPIWYKSI